jgi:hypothetical protein
MTNKTLREEVTIQVRQPHTKHSYAALNAPTRKRVDNIMTLIQSRLDSIEWPEPLSIRGRRDGARQNLCDIEACQQAVNKAFGVE